MSFDPGPRADVRTEGDRTLVFVRELRHAPQRVWALLVRPELLARWAPYTADRDLGAPGPATLSMLDGPDRQDVAGTVLRAEPPTLLEHAWGTDVLRWELEPAGAGTRLTLRHTVQGRQWLPMVAAGWQLCLVVADRLLADRPIEPIRGPDAKRFGWQELHDAYAEDLGTAD
jgi:uncharacterized protein YndB with AHSA1/START domain